VYRKYVSHKKVEMKIKNKRNDGERVRYINRSLELKSIINNPNLRKNDYEDDIQF
jgi:hypothetical protein